MCLFIFRNVGRNTTSWENYSTFCPPEVMRLLIIFVESYSSVISGMSLNILKEQKVRKRHSVAYLGGISCDHGLSLPIPNQP